ncbi:N-(5'-phosphoribosyl)anthranilate isomerase [Aquicoccus porphyridii]|uniref:N-(5'-phosphoribosyl)anthranilate isomerase n=1 Tax=Aquicoccus porphyridii TaxID=1852029 RepID=A0A5A9ZWX1_9RHOB|nr:N-(5'-phosphoribosyl)anthranilate isomerase [Aquicoccus porphyridii]KAA0921085.1 N-(5'-phosphoribosyl)anthranilate isomerase [Aquicoccus porphyridii]RAI56380.1 N-(5'-phosphoribosyl)anthranilate isomerase [Rhodobacteraceae bacterium AsT-22]
MQMVTRKTRADAWIDQVFSARAARKGAVIRRSIAWIHREVGQDRFFAEVRKRGHRLMQTADQYIVVCHNGPIHILI